MSKFINLVRNEHMKTFRRLSTWIMLGIAAALLITIAAFTAYYAEDSNGDWRANTEQQIQDLQKQVEAGELDAADIQQDLTTMQYQLDHDIAPVQNDSLASYMESIMYYCAPFLILFIAIIAGGLVSSEFGTGTIKLLLTKTPSRFSVLTSKYVSMLVTTVIFFVFFIGFSFIIGGIFFGFNGFEAKSVVFDNGEAVTNNILASTLRDYGLNFVQTLIYATIAFALSAIFRNTALAIGFSIFISMFFPTISFILSRYDWSKYILFNNVDLTVYNPGNVPPVDGMTIGFSVAVMAIYFVIITGITWFSFMKRDVTA
ncbi:ABC-2 type transport system permease protein [Terribacillus halophilus]|uniref:ABC-2 type transport system permease protein n=1 Tax=Terribacillus halophilus TaxID=361279 RepID=A0A1G6RPM7_9BACI|nr:ABC transporter permease [Terribacillus halophilus]SDD05886.1 ABC-2 type transport system permease protein [Terribacillus halophilus]